MADIFEISESYCQKIYSRYARILAKVETLPNRKKLLENPPDTLIIDVTEQPIERPVKGQKPYYSGQKKKHTIKVQILARELENFYLLILLIVLKDRPMIFRYLKKVTF